MSMIASGTIGAQNTFTDPVKLRGPFNLSISGTWVGTVTLQRSYDDGSTYVDVESYTANQELIGDAVSEEDVLYRIGIKTGDYTSGNAIVRLSQ